MQVITWTTDNQLFGLPIHFCKEISENVSIENIPGSEEHIVGLTNIRGEVLTVVNVSQKSRDFSNEGSMEAVVVRLKEDDIAILIDKIDEIIDMDIKDESKLSGESNTHLNQFRSNLINFENQVINLLEPNLLEFNEKN